MLSFMDEASARKVSEEIACDCLSQGLPYSENRKRMDALLHVAGAYLSPKTCSMLDALKAAHIKSQELWPIALSDAVTEGRPCYYRHRITTVPVVYRGGRGVTDFDDMEVADLYIFNDTVEIVSRNRRRFAIAEMIKIKPTENGTLSIIFRNAAEPLVIVCQEPMTIRAILERLRRMRRTASGSSTSRTYV